uniref:SCP domain-containing protein n=2 Tax=Anopheles atroparvus TaxID=41427 RepID=A0A182IYA8_ANOAO
MFIVVHGRLSQNRTESYFRQTMRSFVLLLEIFTLAEAQYQWTIFNQENINLCSDRSSCGGRPHTMCYAINQTHPRCTKFKPLVLDEKSIKSFMMGHNGLRNKVATNPHRPATDMQLLHWDRDLQSMAERWVRQCLVGYDECDFIGDASFSIGQNIYFHPKPPLVHWEALALSTWFNEKDKLNRDQRLGTLQTVEGNILGQPVYSVGSTPCTGCPQERASCSHVFRGLCGIGRTV